MLRAHPCTFLLLLLPVVRANGQPPNTGRADTVGHRWTYDGARGSYTAEVVATGYRTPIAIDFLQDGRAVIADRTTARLTLLDIGTGRASGVDGAPATLDSLDAGLLDVVVHPDFARNGLLYLAYVEPSDTGATTVLERATLRGGRLTERQRLFAAFPAMASAYHLGARVLLHQGYVFLALGDRHSQDLAQELWTHHGKIVRLFEDGRVPPDNPFVGRAGARPEIWSLGHRNPHGLAVRPGTGELWASEHGPLGGDEVNLISRGANYGWPIVTHGREYNGEVIGDGLTERAGMVGPARHWSGSAALSGLLFYTGSAFPEWRGDAFVGAMTPRFLSRLTFENGRPAREERLLLEQRWRVRAIAQGPDGFIYLGVQRSSARTSDGMIVRLRPVREAR